jgi:protoporphyrin/coproporphyrin ferrochelatase
VTVGLLVMAHGTPADPSEIQPFYTRIRRGRPPDAAQLAELESRYAAIGGVSPLAERTRAQVDALRAELERHSPGRYVVVFGAKHTSPLIEDAVDRLAGAAPDGLEKVIGLVLTPHSSSMGSGEYLARAADALTRDTRGIPFVPVGPWYDDPSLVDLLAGRIRAAGGSSPRTRVIFTAHSLPERIVANGDTYPEQLADSARMVARAAGLDQWSVAWQSAGRTPEPWLGPDVRDEVRRLASSGDIEAVVVCPIGFVADHLEVLYDLDVELAAVADECGIAYARTASLNDDPGFVGMLAGLVQAVDVAEGAAESDRAATSDGAEGAAESDGADRTKGAR